MVDVPQNSSRPPCHRDDALAIVKRLREHGHVAYFAGGCVRDLLLGLEPKDYDVATDAPPTRVRELFNNTQAVGAAFGVILVRHRKSIVEVATFRADMEYHDGRRPVGVRFTSAEEDAKRRDFTINGLFLDPIEDRVIDYVGGQDDLRAKVLRAIGEANHRFEEDHLRLIRAVRFAARFSLTIENATANAISRHAQHLTRISPERVGEELRLILVPPTRLTAWEILWRFGLMQVIFRALPEKPSAPHDSALFLHLAPEATVSFPLALATMALCFRRSAKPIVELLEEPEIRRIVQACRTTLKISNDESDSMERILRISQLLRDQPPGVATMKRFLAGPESSNARKLLAALRASDPGIRRVDWLEQQFALLSNIAPPPLITGDDLVAAGHTPGRQFKKVLDDVYDAQLEDRIATKDQALQLSEELFKPAG